jgi:hypothetical protein
MFKKVVLFVFLMMLVVGTVHASSINGDYKGNPIVKVTSNGKQLETDEVPAMIYDGHTVVPISLLRQLGASVIWDGVTYAVDVKLPETTTATTPDLKKLTATLVDEVSAIEYMISNDDFTQLSFKLKFDASDVLQLSKYQKVLEKVGYGVKQIRLEDLSSNGSIYIIMTKNIKELHEKKITPDEFNKRIVIQPKSNQLQQPTNNQPIQQNQSYYQPQQQPQAQNNNAQIISQNNILSDFYVFLQNSVDVFSSFVNTSNQYFQQWYDGKTITITDSQLEQEYKKAYAQATEIYNKGKEVYPKLNTDLTVTNQIINEIYALSQPLNDVYVGLFTWKIARFDTPNDVYGANISVAKEHFNLFTKQVQVLQFSATQIKAKIISEQEKLKNVSK